MPFTSRIFRHLETELNKNLACSYSIEENLTRPESRQIRPGDHFRIRVVVRNDSSLKMTNVRGTVRPTSGVSFAATRFRIEVLMPRREHVVAHLDAVFVRAPTRGAISDRIAHIDVAGQADLSAFWFRDTQRPLTYSPAATPAAASSRTRPTPRRAEADVSLETRSARWIDVFAAPLASTGET